MAEIYTSDFRSLNDPDKLIITAKMKTCFSPTWELVMSFRKKHINWEQYSAQYHLMMLESYRNHRDKWDEVLSKPRTVLICYCQNFKECHRTLLACYFSKLGAFYRGEI